MNTVTADKEEMEIDLNEVDELRARVDLIESVVQPLTQEPMSVDQPEEEAMSDS